MRRLPHLLAALLFSSLTAHSSRAQDQGPPPISVQPVQIVEPVENKLQCVRTCSVAPTEVVSPLRPYHQLAFLQPGAASRAFPLPAGVILVIDQVAVTAIDPRGRLTDHEAVAELTYYGPSGLSRLYPGKPSGAKASAVLPFKLYVGQPAGSDAPALFTLRSMDEGDHYSTVEISGHFEPLAP